MYTLEEKLFGSGCDHVRVTLHEFAESLGNAIDARDHGTWAHSDEVAEVSLVLAQCMGASSVQRQLIHIAGHLHDIGKLALPDVVLNKPGALSEEEWAMVREHPGRGADIVRPVPEFAAKGGVADMIRAHHERWDGGGYPDGLSGKAIPSGARIIAVADGLSAMMQDRPYRKGMSYVDACREVRRCSGTQYDPMVVSCLLANRSAVFDAIMSVEESGVRSFAVRGRRREGA